MADLESIFRTVQLASDMTGARNFASDDVATLLDHKILLDAIDYGDFEDDLEELESEIESEAKRAVEAQGVDFAQRDAVMAELSRNTALRSHFRNLKTAKELIAKIREEGDLDDETLVDACNLMLHMTRIRLERDAVPLIARGIYGAQVADAIATWDRHRDSKEGEQESFWQAELASHHTILARVLGGNVVLMGEQQAVGSAGLDRSGAQITDYLFRNRITRNATLVEIKTPGTPLLGHAYRKGFALSQDLSGTVAQVLLQRDALSKHYFQKQHSTADQFDIVGANCVVIAGSGDREIGEDTAKANAFEAHRDALASHVRIITFDELYAQFALFHHIDSQIVAKATE